MLTLRKTYLRWLRAASAPELIFVDRVAQAEDLVPPQSTTSSIRNPLARSQADQAETSVEVEVEAEAEAEAEGAEVGPAAQLVRPADLAATV